MISSLVLSQMPRRGVILSAPFNERIKKPFFLVVSYEPLPALALSAIGLVAPNLYVEGHIVPELILTNAEA